jgi:hypothetical protein
VPTFVPVADSYSVLHDQVLTRYAAGGVLANDSTNAYGGATVLGINGETAAIGEDFTLPSGATLHMNANGGFVYSPLSASTYTDSFAYTGTDGIDSGTATVTIDVTNTAPVATDTTITTLQDTVAPDINFATDADGDTLTLVVASAPSNGTAAIGTDGQLEYIPNAGYVGTDNFTVKANDGVADSNTVTISVTVAPPPVINSVTLDNYLANYDDTDDDSTADDVVTAQVDATNLTNAQVAFQYVWEVSGQVVRTDTTASVTDTFDLTGIGDGECGAQIDVTVSLLNGGDTASQGAATIVDQSAPSGSAWVIPPLTAPANPPSAPTFTFPAGQTTFVFRSNEGAPKDYVLGKVVSASTSGNPIAYRITGGNANGWVKIDRDGEISVAVGSLPLTAVNQLNLTVLAGDAANPNRLPNQTSATVTILLKPTVMITGDFQGVAAPVGGFGCEDNIDLKFVRLSYNLTAPLTVLYTINWNGGDPSAELTNSDVLANTLDNAGQVTFGAGQSVVDVVLYPSGVFSTSGQWTFSVQLDTPSESDGYVLPGAQFWIPSMFMTGMSFANVTVYDGTCLFASNNDAGGLADPGDSVNINDIQQGSIGDCFFLSAVGAIAQKDPTFIHDMIHDNGDGTATVNFFATPGAAATPITVTMTLDNGYSQAELSEDYELSADGTHWEYEIWPQVLEKAYGGFLATLPPGSGGPQTLNDGGRADIAWQQMTTQAATNTVTTSMSATDIATQIKSAYAAGQKVVLSSNTSMTDPYAWVDLVSYQLVSGHAYVLQAIEQDAVGDDVLVLYNPHGGDPNSPVPDGNAIKGPTIRVTLAEFKNYFWRFQTQ